MDGTDRHCRYFHRLMSRRARLYTEMITAEAAANIPRTNMHKLTLELLEDGDSFTVLSSEWERASAGNLVF